MSAEEPEGGRRQLARLLDREALDDCAGPRGRLRVTVPRAWIAEGARLSVAVPARVTCARCDGGGCDACGRGGALRAPEDAAARMLEVRLSNRGHRGGAGGVVAIRIVRPFGSEASVAQLLLEVEEGDRPSAGVARIADPAAEAHGGGGARTVRASAASASGGAGAALWVALALVLLALAAVASGR